MKTLVIVRGLPGSGKSTWAKQRLDDLSKNGVKAVHLEADMFFDRDGEYKWDPKKLRDAHAWCQASAAKALSSVPVVIVSNTFSRIWEMSPYLEMAEWLGAEVEVIKACGEFGNIHAVPEKSIEQMRTRWQDYPGERRVGLQK